MDSIRASVDERAVLELLATLFEKPASGLQAIDCGPIVRAFTFSVGGADYVIRFNPDTLDANFEKEEYVATHYASPSVPIPEVVWVGRMDELHYCITRKIVGQRMDQLSPGELERAVPSAVETLIAIHATDITRQEGYGLFDGQGRGFSSSWPEYLAAVKDEERSDGFFGKWHSLFETTFLERDVFDRIYARLESLLERCPSERYLVHGLYGFRNLLFENGRVTAVLDWIDAKFGDFLYDVAWLDFYDQERAYPKLFRASYAERDIDVPDFDDRLLCYQCYIALDAMRFFAKTNDCDSYTYVKNRILALVSP